MYIYEKPILNECRILMETFQQVRLNHLFREANCCAYSLAGLGNDLRQIRLFFYDIPTGFLNLLAKDNVTNANISADASTLDS